MTAQNFCIRNLTFKLKPTWVLPFSHVWRFNYHRNGNLYRSLQSILYSSDIFPLPSTLHRILLFHIIIPNRIYLYTMKTSKRWETLTKKEKGAVILIYSKLFTLCARKHTAYQSTKYHIRVQYNLRLCKLIFTTLLVLINFGFEMYDVNM